MLVDNDTFIINAQDFIKMVDLTKDFFLSQSKTYSFQDCEDLVFCFDIEGGSLNGLTVVKGEKK